MGTVKKIGVSLKPDEVDMLQRAADREYTKPTTLAKTLIMQGLAEREHARTAEAA